MNKIISTLSILTAFLFVGNVKASVIECEAGFKAEEVVIVEAVGEIAEVSHTEYSYEYYSWDWNLAWTDWSMTDDAPDYYLPEWKKTQEVIDQEFVAGVGEVTELQCVVDVGYVEPAPVVKKSTGNGKESCSSRAPHNSPDGFYIYAGNTLKWATKSSAKEIDIRAYDEAKNFLFNVRTKDDGTFFLNGLSGAWFKIRGVDEQCGLSDWTKLLHK